LTTTERPTDNKDRSISFGVFSHVVLHSGGKTKANVAPSEAAAAQAGARPAAAGDRAPAAVRAAHGTEGVGGQLSEWLRMEGAWWAASFVFHTLLMAVLMLVPHTVSSRIEDDAPSFEEAKTDAATPPPQLERFEVGKTAELPTDLTTESLSLTKAPEIQASADTVSVQGQDFQGGGFAGVTASGPTLGGLGSGFDVMGLGSGPARAGKGGIGVGPGFGDRPGAGGSGVGSRRAPP